MSEPLRLAVFGLELEIRWYGPPRDSGPSLVLLHEGLGSLGLWRDFPGRLVGVAGSIERLVLASRGRAPHRDQAEAVLEPMCTFAHALPT